MENQVENKVEGKDVITTIAVGVIVVCAAYTIVNAVQLYKMLHAGVSVITIDTDWMKQRLEEMKKNNPDLDGWEKNIPTEK